MHPGATHGDSGATRAPAISCHPCYNAGAASARAWTKQHNADGLYYLFSSARSMSTAMILIRPGRPSMHTGISDAAHAIRFHCVRLLVLPSVVCRVVYA